MQVTANEDFTATIVDPNGNVEYLGARIEVPITREIVSYWRPATLDGLIWTVDIEAPIEPGEYLFVWRTGDPEPPDFETFIPLFAVAGSTVSDVVEYPLVTAEDVRPTVEDISNLENTRTTTGGGGEQTDFTETSRPSYSQVEELIDQAVPAVLTQIREPRFDPTYYDKVKHAIALYTAMLVEGGFFREQVDGSSADLWRTLFNQTMVNLQESITRDLNEYRTIRRLY